MIAIYTSITKTGRAVQLQHFVYFWIKYTHLWAWIWKYKMGKGSLKVSKCTSADGWLMLYFVFVVTSNPYSSDDLGIGGGGANIKRWNRFYPYLHFDNSLVFNSDYWVRYLRILIDWITKICLAHIKITDRAIKILSVCRSNYPLSTLKSGDDALSH